MTGQITTEIRNRLAEILLPPKRETVPQAAEKYVILNTPGGYSGPWSNDLPHYMVEPAECLTAREFEAVIFSGPAQTGKTQMLIDNWIAHTVVCDPADMMILQPTKEQARDFSKRRVDRMHNNCPEIKARLKPNASADNTHDKFYRSGMILTIASGTATTVAGKAIGKIGATDYDRSPDDVGANGSLFGLMLKRTESFLSRGMVLVESSPSKEVINSDWKIDHAYPHEAPPTKGVLGLYNTGDRRRLYGQCQCCGEYWMPSGDITDLFIPDTDVIDEIIETGGLICSNGCINTFAHENAFKRTFTWLKEGQTINESGDKLGEGNGSNRASFWMHGWAAAFQKWSGIVSDYKNAQGQYERTGDEQDLKTFYNTTLGLSFIPHARRNQRHASIIQDRAEPLTKRTVPQGVRFLTAAVDVQKRSFEVQVQGWGVNRESWVIDRYSITMSKRTDDGNPIAVDPASYLEDWEAIKKQVIDKTYPLDDASGRDMTIKRVRCDSGGVDGVTDNAYNYFRRVKKLVGPKRFGLLKGGSQKNAPRIKITLPDNQGNKKRKASARGDIPVLMLNTNALKDMVDASLKREDVGPNYIHFPDWLPDSYYEEITAEKKTDKGWKKEPGSVNDSLDLLCYNLAIALDLGIEIINWQLPPAWAAEWEANNNFPIENNSAPKLNPFAVNAHKSSDPYLS